MGYGSQTLPETIGATVLFFVLGQIAVIIFGGIFQLITSYDDQEEAKKGNVADNVAVCNITYSIRIEDLILKILKMSRREQKPWFC